MANVALIVNGVRYAGWQNLRVTRSLEAVSGSFDLGVTERWFDQEKDWPIGEGDVCTVEVEGQTVLTGFIDERDLSYGPSDHSVSLRGRDKAGDLVDSSAILDKWSFKNISLLSFVQKICKPFNIPVTVQAGLAASPIAQLLTIDPGDTAYNAIEQACRAVGVLVVSDGRGGVVITRAGKELCTTALVEGVNILAASASYSFNDRFSEYLVLGQSHGSANNNGRAAAAVRGSAVDIGVTRTHRRLLVRPEHAVTIAQAKTRAEWEATTREARSQSFSITVQGWTQGDGKLWPVNQLVRVKSPKLGVDSTLLISQVTYSYSRTEGTTTQISLRPPQAFLPQPRVGKSERSYLWPEIAKGV